jgi:SOS response regulatory protein OraA/RecX
VPKGNTGKLIQSIQVKKKAIILTFLGDETLTLSPQSYTDYYLYPGKVIDSDLFHQLEAAQSLQPLKDYAFSLLSKGKYSEWQVREKLYRREAKKYQVEEIIQTLKAAHLIDDVSLFHQWVEHYHQRGYGLKWIEQKMYEKGFAKDLVTTLPSLTQPIPHVIEGLIKKMMNQYRSLSQRERFQKISLSLQRRGYEFRQIQTYLEPTLTDDSNLEMTNLKQAFTRIYHRYQSRYQGRELREKIINFLLAKGYTYGNIQKVIKESTYGD